MATNGEAIDRVVALADQLHTKGRDLTTRRRYAEGVLYRRIANEIRQSLDLPPLDINGNETTTDDQGRPL